MRADPNGTHTEQQRARAGWINATTRRAKIRDGDGIVLGRACSTCDAWTGSLINTRALCDRIGCSTHVAATCDRWASHPAFTDRPHPVRPCVE